MTLMYYFILAFGAILFLYTAQGWRKTRRKIHPHDVSLDKTKNRIAEIKKCIQPLKMRNIKRYRDFVVINGNKLFKTR
ncbi:hypothetical protein [Pasteurella multocida]|uniref:hypothetical protein n=1 Tax=Pasteurella multocida TaxID=747 RepID=UPI00202009D5|nr:hypothetical protein [Pasteurella multocida]MCL7845191.1 hypothetical protein [Pasteurella multocida]